MEVTQKEELRSPQVGVGFRELLLPPFVFSQLGVQNISREGGVCGH